MESIHDCLLKAPTFPSEMIRKPWTGYNFTEWAHRIFAQDSFKTEGVRKSVLTYDVYRSFTTAQALHIMRDGDVIGYCLPAHASEVIQLLDVCLCRPFKVAINGVVGRATNTYEDPVFDQIDLLHMMELAYTSAFTTEKLISAFYKASIFHSISFGY